MNNKKIESEAGLWSRRFNLAKTNQETLFDEASKNYDILYAVFNTSNIAPWRSKVYVPILASKAWDLISRLSSIVPRFTVEVENEFEVDEMGNLGISEAARMVEDKIEAYLEKSYLNVSSEPIKLKVQNTLMDAVAAGTGFAKAPWVFEKNTTKARPIESDNINVDLSKEVVKKTVKGYNDFVPVNFFNVFIAPNSSSFFTAPYIIIREFMTKGDIKKSGLYKNIDKIKYGLIDEDFQNYNRSRNSIENASDNQDSSIDYATIFECYDRDNKTIITYAIGNVKDEWVEIRRQVDPYWHGMFPVVPFYIRRKSFSPWGESMFENNSRLQNAVNDLFNHYLDNWNLSVDGMIMYEDNSLTSDFIVQPGGEISYTGEKPSQYRFPEPNPQQLTTVLDVINQALEQATVPQYLSGVPDSQLDKTAGTASGIRSLTEAATEKVAYMKDNFKQSMKVLGTMWASNAKQYMDKVETVKMTADGRTMPYLLSPSDLQREFNVEIDDDSMVPMSKQQMREAQLQFQKQLLEVQGASYEQAKVLGHPEDSLRLDFKKMATELGDIFTVSEAEKFILPTDAQPAQPPMQPPMAPEQQMGVM